MESRTLPQDSQNGGHFLRTDNGLKTFENKDYIIYTLMFIHFIFIGAIGGLSYANTMYQFNNNPKIPDDLRELCVNTAMASLNFGILLATGLSIILNKSVMSDATLYAPNEIARSSAMVPGNI